jgi:hypothetical protein
MSDILYVGISGKMRHGKDTFAKMVMDRLQPTNRVLRRAFADALKEEVIDLLAAPTYGAAGFPEKNFERRLKLKECLYSDDPKEKEPFRLMLQWWGTEFRRGLFGDDYWLFQMDDWAEEMETETRRPEGDQKLIIVIPDVRFPSEVQFIKQYGGILARIHRPSMPEQNHHSSETALDAFTGWDCQVYNDTLEWLQIEADNFCQNFIEPRL